MEINMGGLDRGIRGLVAAIALILVLSGFVTGIISYLLIAISVVFGFTVVTGKCLIYKLIGINTCGTDED